MTPLSPKTSLSLGGATIIASVLVALIPSLAPEKELIIAIGGIALGLLIPVINAIHIAIVTKAKPEDLAHVLEGIVKGELDQLGIAPMVEQSVASAVKGQDVSALVQAEVNRVLGGLLKQPITARTVATITPAPIPAPPGPPLQPPPAG